MRLIESIAVDGFRSIRSAKLGSVGDFTAFAGLNNSGKSNALRALNAFFNDETEPGVGVRLDEDYYRPDLRNKKAKRIRVSVTFDLPTEFKFRKGLEAAEALLGGRRFEVAKEWTRAESEPAYYLNGARLNADDRHKINQFLQLVNFRYVPNRVQPLDVVRSEHQALRDVLVRRLGRKAKGAKATFDAVRQTSESLIQSLSARFQEALPSAGEVRLATPGSWAEMVFAFGYRLSRGGVELPDSVQGSGTQSLLMLETLYLIDRDYFQKFGWRQAAIWAVEEPESSLHTSLEARVALYLATIATESTSRLQVFCTTHSDLMLQYATKPVIVEQVGAETTFIEGLETREVLERVSQAGVSRYVHPVMHFPLDPLLIVEGKIDEAFITEALKHYKCIRPMRVTYLEKLGGPGQTGGVEDTARYVRDNAPAIRARPKDAPVIVVLDWDSVGKKAQFTKHFLPTDPFKVLVWPESSLNPKSGTTFHGIERCYSERIILEGEKRGMQLARKKDGTFLVQSDDYGAAKLILAEIVREGLDPADLQHARSFLDEILKAAGVTL
jgi:predicted ATPase